jgi:hypothetical protein
MVAVGMSVTRRCYEHCYHMYISWELMIVVQALPTIVLFISHTRRAKRLQPNPGQLPFRTVF